MIYESIPCSIRLLDDRSLSREMKLTSANAKNKHELMIMRQVEILQPSGFRRNGREMTEDEVDANWLEIPYRDSRELQ